MKISFFTLGCKVNQNESASLRRLFEDAGYETAETGEVADIYIINSCTVTAQGDAKSRRQLNRAKKENPNAVTVLTGCYPQAFPQEAALAGADIVTGTRGRTKLISYVESFLENRQRIIDLAEYGSTNDFEELPVAAEHSRTRAFVKIEDGCNRRCAYCIIPTARGQIRSRSEASIISELTELAAKGHKEVVFTGINLPSYGKDTGTNLADIVEKAAKVNGIERIRLSSLDPDLITEDMARRLAKVPEFCRQFHLSLQSGCDATLRRMRRPYTAQRYAEAAAMLRQYMPGASLTTDVIVGFPGETDAEFAESLAFVERMQFLKVHVFPYSRRPGTAAASFEGQVPKALKHERAKQMQAAADVVRHEVSTSFIGSIQRVLLEKPDSNHKFSGYTENYIPVKISAPLNKQGDIISITLTPDMLDLNIAD